MTPRHWWLGVSAIVAALVFHALVPRYEIRDMSGRAGIAFYTRVDRWTGRATLERMDHSALTAAR